MMGLPLSRTLALTDYAELGPELAVVDTYGIPGQHEHRRWEYALALHAVRRWAAERDKTIAAPCYDIGGGGSTFASMLASWIRQPVGIIDPSAPRPQTLEQFCRAGTPLTDVVTCLSVIEHVEDVDAFLYRLACLLAPGGLLVLTMDYWNACGPDTAHFHWMRQRIFCPKSYAALRATAERSGLRAFGEMDRQYHGAFVHDYTFASFVAEKRLC